MDNNNNMQNTPVVDDREENVIKTASKAVSKKFSEVTWKTIEVKLPDNDKLVLDVLIKIADAVIRGKIDSVSVDRDKMYVITDQYYPMIRKIFADAGLVIASHDSKNKPNKELIARGCDPNDYMDLLTSKMFGQSHSKGKKSGSKGRKFKGVKISKADMIRLSNTVSKLRKISEDFVDVSNLDAHSLQPQLGFRSDYVELIGMTFIYMIRYILMRKDRYSKAKYHSQVVGLMISVQRFIDKCRNYEGLDPVSPGKTAKISELFIKDLELAYEDIDKVFPFNGLDVCEKMPELLVYSELDKHIPQLAISPRDHQKEITSSVFRNFKTGFFTVYNAMIGSGKTTAIVALAKLAEFFGLTMLCVCNLDTVRTQMANICYNAEIKFAIGSIRDNGTVKLTNHFSCKKDSDRRVIICGPDVGYAILKDKSDDKILFHDEPNSGADIKQSDTLRSNVNIMRVMPKWTIYSSATAPVLEDLEPAVTTLREQYPGLVVNKVYSPTVHIGCDVRTLGGELVVPYIGCTDEKDLKNVIKKCEDVPFLGRMLTTKVAMHLWRQMGEAGIAGLPDIPVMFRNVNNMKADKIRQIVLNMLELLFTQKSDVIKRICKSTLTDIDAIEKTNPKKVKPIEEEEDDGFDWASESDGESDTKSQEESKHPLALDLNNLGTGEIWKNATLIASNDPCKDAVVLFKSLLDELAGEGVKSAERILSNHQRNLRSFESKKVKTLKNLHKVGASKKSENVGKSDNTGGMEIRKARLENEMDGNRPRLGFPEWAHIGTKAYISKFVETKKHSQIMDLRFPMDLEALEVDIMNVPDEFILLLFCGVGIYSPDNKDLDANYTSLVMDLASAGKLAYVVADNSISFGTNYPFARVIILEAFSKEHSIYTQYQLMGRAGRVGKSAKAEARVSDEMARSIVDFVIHPERYNIEIENILDMLKLLKDEEDQAIQAELARMEEEILRDLAPKKKASKPDVVTLAYVPENPLPLDEQMEKTLGKDKDSIDDSLDVKASTVSSVHESIAQDKLPRNSSSSKISRSSDRNNRDRFSDRRQDGRYDGHRNGRRDRQDYRGRQNYRDRRYDDDPTSWRGNNNRGNGKDNSGDRHTSERKDSSTDRSSPDTHQSSGKYVPPNLRRRQQDDRGRDDHRSWRSRDSRDRSSDRSGNRRREWHKDSDSNSSSYQKSWRK